MTETTEHPPRTRRSSATLTLAVISLVPSLISCAVAGLFPATNDWDLLPVQSKPEIASAGQVEAVAHVTLPPGAVLLTAAYSNGLETRLSAKFRIPRSQLDAFLASDTFTAALTPGLRAINATENVGAAICGTPTRRRLSQASKNSNPAPTARAECCCSTSTYRMW
ncbi:MAG: hypothetical protein QOE61_526 [Micromonosporaceae bacterium]|nr:hypothetical protein [Micromonosporaceae bacterium]